MLQVISYLKSDEKFINIQDFYGQIEDVDYIEGAIEIMTEDKILLSLYDWDYIDQMWCYIVEGLNTVKAGQKFSTYFPDHPTEFIFIPHKESQTVDICVKSHEDLCSRIDYDEFMTVMIDEAVNFFENLSRICEDLREFCLDMIEQLNQLKT